MQRYSTKNTFILLTIVLVIPTIIMFVRNSLYDFDHARHMGMAQAHSIIHKDKSLRNWAASHGGVYVPVDERTPPNPYLTHVPNRDITYKEMNLTLMNPAYMLRQVIQEHEGLYGAKSKITSLKPLNPHNTPDAWETKALKEVETNSLHEYFEFIQEADGEKLRFLEPFHVEPDCLKCHASQGYQVGDVRGGISVTIPMTHYYSQARTMVKLKIIALSTAILTIVVMMYFVYRQVEKNRRRELEQQQIIFEQSKQAALGEMIGAIAHQMKQPLNIMGLSTQEIEADIEDGILKQETVERHCKTLMTEIIYLSDTIDDFRNFFRPDKEKQYFYLHEAVKNSLKILEVQLRIHEITVTITGDDMEIHGNKNELQQVVINLVNNAKDALMEQPDNDNRTITITGENLGSFCQFTVADNGGGIPQEHMNRLFTPYFTTKAEKGTGIGLYMCQMIVEKSFSGTITAGNQDGGAVFTVRFPLDPA